MATCKECLHYDACVDLLESMGYIVDGDGIDADKRCNQFIHKSCVAPVVHGRWEWDTEDVYECSNCGEKSHVKEVMGQAAWDFCPNCGCRMDEKEGE